MSLITESLDDFYFGDLINFFIDHSYYQFLFPFLLIFALLTTILPFLSFFKNKKTKEVHKSAVVIISLIISIFSVSFKLPSGHTIGDFLGFIFPDISTLTMLVLVLYLVGAMIGKNFFEDVFDKDVSAYMVYAIGALGLGAVVYYTGIVMGLWDYNPLDSAARFNFTLAMACLILAIVFIIIGLYVPGIVLGAVFFAYISNGGEGSFLGYFIDPVVFIAGIFAFFLTFLQDDDSKRNKMAKELRESEKSIDKFIKENGNKKPKDYDSKIFDIMDRSFEKKKKSWDKKFPGQSWKN